MMERAIVKVSRGLVIALLITVMTASYIEIGFGLTVDDFKAYIGYTVQQANDTVVVDVGNDAVNSKEDENTGREASTVEQLNSNLQEYEKMIEQKMLKDGNTKHIILVINEAIQVKSKLELAKELEKAEKAGEINSELINELVQNINSLENIDLTQFDTGDIAGRFYDIGYFGKYYEKPVENTLRLITPYGYRKLDNGKYENKHLGIDLVAYEGNTITSMFNGVIARIEEDSSGDYNTITVYHGNGMYTLYHHVIADENLAKGKKLKVGNVIGTAGNTEKHEPNKENHILFQVIIDGTYVNPLYVFGETGEKMYKDWMAKSTDIYAVDVDEEHFHTVGMEKENINKDLEPNIIYEDAKVDSEYRLPSPGILK